MTKQYRRTQFLNNCLYITIPKAYRDALDLKKGEYVSIELVNNTMIVEPANPSAKIDSQASHSLPPKEGAAND